MTAGRVFLTGTVWPALRRNTPSVTWSPRPPAPDIPYPSRVTVRREVDGWPHYYGTWTRTPPVLGYEGIWLVGVSLDGKVQFVPVDDVTIAKEQRRGRG